MQFPLEDNNDFPLDVLKYAPMHFTGGDRLRKFTLFWLSRKRIVAASVD